MNEEIIALLWSIDNKLDNLNLRLKALEDAVKTKEANDEHTNDSH
jgi:hypothetical protein